MDLIIDFYKSLDTLNLIIFWGIIIVIILLLIFSFILMNKNKKLKNLVEEKDKKQYLEATDKEDIPVITETIVEKEEKTTNNSEIFQTKKKNEKTFIAEEHIMEYNQEPFLTTDKMKEEQTVKPSTIKPPIEMPTGPYQRNVLREMSLSQTSPIGINRINNLEDKKNEIVKDLDESLHNEEFDSSPNQEHKTLNKLEEISAPAIKTKNDLNMIKKDIVEPKTIKIEPEKKEIWKENLINQKTESPQKELLELSNEKKRNEPTKSSSEKYLEEVSRKLAEAEIPDEVERTNYELQQEEDAIISYTELMEKKDSIQTIDEEDAVISIEELMNRKKEEEDRQESAKLYNLGEEEENDNFIKELKQFRNDL